MSHLLWWKINHENTGLTGEIELLSSRQGFDLEMETGIFSAFIKYPRHESWFYISERVVYKYAKSRH